MCPARAIDNPADLSALNKLQLLGDAFMRPTSVGQPANVGDIVRTEFGTPVLLASTFGCALLRDSVSHVVQLSAKKQMRRIDAGRRIAPMKNSQLLGDWSSVMQLPSNPRCNELGAAAVCFDSAISLAVFGPLPQPAFVGRSGCEAVEESAGQRQRSVRHSSGLADTFCGSNH